jgi:hypothetical protein
LNGGTIPRSRRGRGIVPLECSRADGSHESMWPLLKMTPCFDEIVAIRLGKPDQRWLDTITLDEARAYIQSGEFGAGWKEPKVAAVA